MDMRIIAFLSLSMNLHWVYNVNLQDVCTIECLNMDEYTVTLSGAIGPYEIQQQRLYSFDWKYKNYIKQVYYDSA